MFDEPKIEGTFQKTQVLKGDFSGLDLVDMREAEVVLADEVLEIVSPGRCLLEMPDGSRWDLQVSTGKIYGPARALPLPEVIRLETGDPAATDLPQEAESPSESVPLPDPAPVLQDPVAEVVMSSVDENAAAAPQSAQEALPAFPEANTEETASPVLRAERTASVRRPVNLDEVRAPLAPRTSRETARQVVSWPVNTALAGILVAECLGLLLYGKGPLIDAGRLALQVIAGIAALSGVWFLASGLKARAKRASKPDWP